jgi:hypothetical protein
MYVYSYEIIYAYRLEIVEDSIKLMGTIKHAMDHICIYIYVYIYIHVYIYIYIYMYTHTK